ncbi:recombinase family protein [Streptomyces sp. NPDC001093]|uniref:recombinase family protein n=1 Tax=Streptomyces sp. NPDC001093 TaxID=3154376 RepID=UPI00331B87A8
MTDPQQPSTAERSDADDVEQSACPQCDAPPGSPCPSRGGAIASAYQTRRFTMVPRLKKAQHANPGRPQPRAPLGPLAARHPALGTHRPGSASADIRIGYARCSTLGQALDSQLDALSKHGIPRDKIFNEEDQHPRPRTAGLRRGAEDGAGGQGVHPALPGHVCELKRLGRDAAELTALADHLTARGLVLEMPAGAPAWHLRPHRAGEAAVRIVRRDGGDRTGSRSNRSSPT